MRKGRRFTAVPCTLEHAIAGQIHAISEGTGIPVAPIVRKFFGKHWADFLNGIPEWKALAEARPVEQPSEMKEGETTEAT